MAAPTCFEDIAERLRSHKATLRQTYGLSRIGVFGSFVRGEQHPGSDVDLLVELERPMGLFRFQQLERDLAQLLEAQVDLVTPGALKPNIGRRVLGEVRDV
jgi:predicted nucleotidyltransferase